MLSILLPKVISFHLLGQDAMFLALNFLFYFLISSSIYLTCVSQCAGISALVFSCNSCCRIGTWWCGCDWFCMYQGFPLDALWPPYKKEGWILFCGDLWGGIDIVLPGVNEFLEIANSTLLVWDVSLIFFSKLFPESNLGWSPWSKDNCIV